MPIYYGDGHHYGDGFIYGADDPSAPPTFRDGQIKLGPITMGPGTPYTVTEFSPRAAPDVRSSDINRGQTDGLFPVEGRFGGRHVEFSLSIHDTSRNTVLADYDQLSAAFRPTGDITSLIWKEAGMTYRLNGQTRGTSPDESLLHGNEMPVTVRFLATDPRIFSDTGRNVVVASREKGLIATPWTTPLTVTAPVGHVATISNAGSAATPWRAEIDGPSRNPSIENIDTGQILQFVGDLAADESLVLDSALGTWFRDGLSPIAPKSFLRWWEFPPADSHVQLRGGGSLNVSWRDAHSW